MGSSGKLDPASLRCTAMPLTSELVLFVVEASAPPGSQCLTDAEREVAGLAALGFSNHAIARRRGCSTSTVANQLASVYSKLSLSGRRELRCALAQREAP
jgi:DNA-binding NarL/FixJ family response regulator